MDFLKRDEIIEKIREGLVSAACMFTFMYIIRFLFWVFPSHVDYLFIIYTFFLIGFSLLCISDKLYRKFFKKFPTSFIIVWNVVVVLILIKYQHIILQ